MERKWNGYGANKEPIAEQAGSELTQFSSRK